MKRLCIYLTYDKQNIVDKYIEYMLKELRTCVDKLVVVCNMTEVLQGMEYITAYADSYFLRENVGLDIGGFKDSLCNLLGWNEVLKFDELILANDSFFGPFIPMKDIFMEMDRKPVDFWGLTKHAQCRSEERVYCPEHLQSFFTVVRKKMLHSDVFRCYWEKLPYFSSFNEAVKQHELVFTQYFGEHGYQYDCYADMKPNDSFNLENNFIQYSSLPYELIKKRKFPFFKKQQLSYDTSDMHTQENQSLALKYIEENTNYDINMIWENLIRTMDVTDLYRNFHLQYILESEGEGYAKEKEESICILLFITYASSYEYVMEYLERLSGKYTFIICAEEDEIIQSYHRAGREVCKLENKAIYKNLLRKAADFTYICIIKDTDMTSDLEPSFVGKSYFYSIWENLLKNNFYISKVIRLFEQHKWLGFLAPPIPMFYDFFGELGSAWGEEYEVVRKTAESLGVEHLISLHRKPMTISDCFWIRGCILKSIDGVYVEKSDFEVMKYLWCYMVQKEGYYSGTVESTEYASIYSVNMQNYLNIISGQVKRQYGDFKNFLQLRQKIFSGALTKFCATYEKIYIYGAGGMAKKYRYMIPKFEAYIVSDGEPKQCDTDGDRIFYLSEIKYQNSLGIVVCLNEKNQSQVVSLLEDYGYTNYICI